MGREYFDKIVDLCREEDVSLLVVNIPYNQGEMDQKVANWVERYAKEKGFDFYNMFRDESLNIDYEKDFCGGSHLNRTGATKVSEALAKYIVMQERK